MSDYRRYFTPGGTYFFTIVTYARRSILTTEPGRKHLRQAVESTRTKRPFDVVATALLPDHWHFIMQLPHGDDNFSTRIKRIKEDFTEAWRIDGLTEAAVTKSQKKRGERGIWQPRFWEHLIEDEDDLAACIDYIHWNPRRHELVNRIRDWKWSSFHRFVKSGDYDIDWGGEAPNSITKRVDQNWGEA